MNPNEVIKIVLDLLTCPNCKGKGKLPYLNEEMPCESCSGTGLKSPTAM